MLRRGLRVWAAGAVLAACLGLGEAAAQELEVDEDVWSAEAAPGEVSPAWEAAKERVLRQLDGLRDDRQVLSALSALQERLLEWNGLLAESGAEMTWLDRDLCGQAELRVWCVLLPATFGRLEEGG